VTGGTFVLVAALTVLLVVLLSIRLLSFGVRGYKDLHCVAEGFGIIGICASLLAVPLLAATGWNWVSAGYRTSIINREYGTDYNVAEVFFASDVIETIRELERERYEINGDIFKHGGQK
jgi:hypothetical protein